jgi:hypothetical protein
VPSSSPPQESRQRHNVKDSIAKRIFQYFFIPFLQKFYYAYILSKIYGLVNVLGKLYKIVPAAFCRGH